MPLHVTAAAVLLATCLVPARHAAPPRVGGAPAPAAQVTPAQVMPAITNATVTTRAADDGLEAAIAGVMRAGSGPAWAGYAVAAVEGDRWMCCESGSRTGDVWTSYACGCRLERGPAGGTQSTGDRPIRLEGAREVLVLVRVEAGRLQKIRTFSSDCPLDGGGLPFSWLTGVRSPDSLAWLSAQARNATEPALARSAVTAIALHADPGADNALRTLLAAEHPMALRKHVVLWLGQARGRSGFAELQRLSTAEPSAELRRQVAFGLSVSKEAEALPELIRMARQDADAGVRGQALFWVAQKAGDRAAPTLAEAIERDPETQVKERAVFGLTQLPKDEGVPLLIKVAKTSPNAAVRRRAIFWLGQSKDARALAFFEEILAGR